MINEYIEIVHLHPDLYFNDPKVDSVDLDTARRIKELEESVGVNYNFGSLDLDNLPNIPFDTPIRIGGGLWEICVQERARNLKKAGYCKVRVDKSISISASEGALRKYNEKRR